MCLHFASLISCLWQKIRPTILYDESLEDGETEDKSVGIFNSFPTSAVVATHFAAMPLPVSHPSCLGDYIIGREEELLHRNVLMRGQSVCSRLQLVEEDPLGLRAMNRV